MEEGANMLTLAIRGRGMRAVLLAVVLAVAASCASILLASPKPAEASFPGKNGLLVFWSTSADGSIEIFTSRLDGFSLKQRTNAPGDSRDPSWSADGTKIAFASNRDGQDYEIYVKDITTGNVSQITHNSESDSDPAGSPDGSKLVFRKVVPPHENCPDDSFTSDIAVVGVGGSDEKPLPLACTFDNNPEWAPDGTKIAFASAKGCGGCDNPTPDILTMKPDGSELTNLTRTDVSREQHFDWSPNGKKIVYGKRTADAENGNIWKMNAADGSQKDRLTFHPDAIEDFPVWSPNGRKILFNGSGGLTKMNVDGTNKTDIPGPPEGAVISLDWQPIH
jgi:Tol biopolymer transport system component